MPYSTAIFPKRKLDKKRLKDDLGLLEFRRVLGVLFYTKDGKPLASGYARVVFTDDGPFVEMDRGQVHWPTLVLMCSKGGFDVYTTPGGTKVRHYRGVSKPFVGPYQTTDPKLWSKHPDFRTGMIYVNPHEITISLPEVD